MVMGLSGALHPFPDVITTDFLQHVDSRRNPAIGLNK